MARRENVSDKSRKLEGQNYTSHMAGVCLQPFYDYLIGFINDHSGAVSCDELAELRKSETLGEINPCSIVLLLSDLCSDKIRFHNNFFTTLPETVITDLETKVIALLTASPNPVHVNVLTHSTMANHPR